MLNTEQEAILETQMLQDVIRHHVASEYGKAECMQERHSGG